MKDHNTVELVAEMGKETLAPPTKELPNFGKQDIR
jgi:hypothetical protein